MSKTALTTVVKLIGLIAQSIARFNEKNFGNPRQGQLKCYEAVLPLVQQSKFTKAFQKAFKKPAFKKVLAKFTVFDAQMKQTVSTTALLS